MQCCCKKLLLTPQELNTTVILDEWGVAPMKMYINEIHAILFLISSNVVYFKTFCTTLLRHISSMLWTP